MPPVEEAFALSPRAVAGHLLDALYFSTNLCCRRFFGDRHSRGLRWAADVRRFYAHRRLLFARGLRRKRVRASCVSLDRLGVVSRRVLLSALCLERRVSYAVGEERRGETRAKKLANRP